MDLATTRDIRIIPFSIEEQKKVCEKYPFYSDYNIAGNIYRGVDEPVPTISVWNMIICKADLDEELIYNLTKVLFEQNEYMQQIHPFARYTTMENTVKHSPVPLHPGTIKYLKEKGLTVPDNLIPGS
jgi:TRAP transporter TAXI family solute receptor